MPLGLRKNRLAVPLARSNPSILETELPVTRLKIFSICKALLKNASPPVGTPNSLKLWNRLVPRIVPPSIVQTVHPGVTLEFTGRVLSGTICAVVGLRVARQPMVMLLATHRRVANGFITIFLPVQWDIKKIRISPTG